MAEAIDAFSRLPFRDSSGADHAGVLTAADLAGWSASYERPVVHRFRDVEVAKTDLWGQGPVLLEALALLDGLPDEALDPTTRRRRAHGHRGPEARARRPRGVVRRRLAGHRRRAARPGVRRDPPRAPRRPGLGRAAPGLPRRPGAACCPPTCRTGGSSPDAAGLGEPTVGGQTRGDTCHLDVVDRWGNIISATPSGGWLQSSPTIPELGFCLGSRLQMCWLDEGLPATLTPGRRPRTTLSPTLVLRDGRPVLACGTPGGDQQDQWQLPFLLHHLVGGLDLQEAIEAPSFHTTSIPSSFYPREIHPGELVAEDRLGPDVLAELEGRGHRLVRAGDWTLGRLSAVARDPDTGLLSAAATARGDQGYAVGR